MRAALADAVSLDSPSPVEMNLLDVVRVTVAKNPNVALQKQAVEFSGGVLKQSAGPFDETLSLLLSHSRTNNPLNSAQAPIFSPPIFKEDQTQYSFVVSKELRSGVILAPSLSFIRTDPISPYAQRSLGVDTETQASFNFSVTVPLLKNSGEDVVDASEKAVREQYEANLFQLTNTVSQNILQAVQAYWAWVAAGKRLAIFVESEQRAQILVDNTRKLIKHDQRPAADIDLTLANLSSNKTSRISAEQAVADTAKNLGLIMGYGGDEISRLKLPARDELAGIVGLGKPEAGTDGYFVARALAYRTDIKALSKQKQGNYILMTAAGKNILPQLDLNLQAGYNTLTEKDTYINYFSAYGQNLSGLNATAAVKFTWPVRNSDARGVYIQQKANYESAVINLNNLINIVSSSVLNDLSSLRKGVDQLEQARYAVDSYRKAVSNEHKKFAMGISTLNDVITNENFLTSAMLDEVSALQNLADTVIDLRYQTGSILLYERPEYNVGLRELTTAPDIVR